MSDWQKITEQDDVEYDPKTKEIEIYIGSDEFGNKYITVDLYHIFMAVINSKE